MLRRSIRVARSSIMSSSLSSLLSSSSGVTSEMTTRLINVPVVRGVASISASQFDAILKDAQKRIDAQIIDCREDSEIEIAKIPGSDILYLPLSMAGAWTQAIVNQDPVQTLSLSQSSSKKVLLDPLKPTICLCHHGVRSMRVAKFLEQQAEFKELYNVEGGIHAYSTSVDESIPVY